MKSILDKKKISMLVIAHITLVIPGLVIAQENAMHDMDNMEDMPGMKMPVETQKDQPTPKKTKHASSNQSNKPVIKHPMHNMPEMDHASMPVPSGQEQQHENMPGMNHGSMSDMPPEHSMSPGMQDKNSNHDMEHAMSMEAMQGGHPPANARDPNAYAEGVKQHPMHGMDMADDALFGRLLVNEFEYADGQHEYGQNLNMEAWYGGDYHKVWFKAEGERRNGRLEKLSTEALWNRIFSTFWSTQLGVRHDTGQGTAQNWLAVGVQGLAPYWFETEATAYVGSGGTLAARADVRYELLLTQRLILQPKVEANFYSKDDVARGIGSGLSDIEAGLRLRYEIRRQFAPYIGVSWKRSFGNTAEFARQAGNSIRNTEFVAGLRVWF